MASKQRVDKQKQKEKKEKIILLALVGVLVVVGALELPKMLKSGGGGSSAATSSVAQTTSTSSSTSPGGTPTSTSAAIGSLPNSIGYQPSAGQMSGFSLFHSSDPFGSSTTASSTTTSSTKTTGTKTTGTKTTGTKTTSTTTRYGTYVGARISTNGSAEDVLLGATFPAASPVFVLSSLSAAKIQISVAGGSFSSGQSNVTIKKGKSVVLVNTVDSTRYAIKFITALTAEQMTSTTGGTTTGGTTTGGTTTGGTTTGGTTT